MGGGGSREEEARNPPPGNSSARQRSEALCHLAIAGARARPRPGPARRGESPAAAAPPHALPRRPRARGRPGQVAAVPGSGRPGAAASERGGGGGGQRRIVLPLGPARAGSAVPGGPARRGSTRPRSPERSLGADARASATRSDSSGTREEPWEQGDRFLQLASLAAKKTCLCFFRLEKWTKTVESVEVRRNHQGVLKGLPKNTRSLAHCFTSPASPRNLVWNSSHFGVWWHFPPNVDSKGLVPSL